MVLGDLCAGGQTFIIFDEIAHPAGRVACVGAVGRVGLGIRYAERMLRLRLRL